MKRAISTKALLGVYLALLNGLDLVQLREWFAACTEVGTTTIDNRYRYQTISGHGVSTDRAADRTTLNLPERDLGTVSGEKPTHSMVDS